MNDKLGEAQPREGLDLERMELADINRSLIKTINIIHKGEYSNELVTKEGLIPSARKTWVDIEKYFKTKYAEGIDDIDKLNEKERAILALGLVLKCADSGAHKDATHFAPMGMSDMAGITFHRLGESGRDRIGFYVQQDWKYGYQINSSEPADFLLLHTTSAKDADLTRYERIQAENFAAADKYVQEALEPEKKGKYTPEDVQTINNILLKGLMPDRTLGKFREKSTNITGTDRIGMTDKEEIHRNLTSLLRYVWMAIEERQGNEWLTDSIDTDLDFFVQNWASFDAIHPMEEGNGRTGMLLFKSWYRLCGGKNNFESPRKDNPKLISAMNDALRGDANISYEYTRSHLGDIQPLMEYVNARLN